MVHAANRTWFLFTLSFSHLGHRLIFNDNALVEHQIKAIDILVLLRDGEAGAVVHGYGIQGKVFNAAVAFEDGPKLEDRTGGGFMEVTGVPSFCRSYRGLDHESPAGPERVEGPV
jgi:hypothetical protein